MSKEWQQAVRETVELLRIREIVAEQYLAEIEEPRREDRGSVEAIHPVS